MKRLAMAAWLVLLVTVSLIFSGPGETVMAADDVPPSLPPLPGGPAGSLPEKADGRKQPPAATPVHPPEKAPPQIPPFRNSEFGAYPHFGTPEDGGAGYRHYDDPAYRYDIWYRPHAFGWGIPERCAPAPFRPRGYGNLFAEPSTCYRMDYNRYVLKNHRTDYGPSYYRRSPDQRCDTYDHSGHYRPECDPCRLRRRTDVWTLGHHRED